MSSLLIPLALLVLAIPLVLALVRANELFCLRFVAGKLTVRRGNVPSKLLEDVGDILRSQPVQGALTLRGVVEDRALRFYADVELHAAQKQQLRNVAGMWPVSKVRAALRRR